MPTHSFTANVRKGDEIVLDVEVTVDFRITASGHPGNGWDDPGEPVEIEIEHVYYQTEASGEIEEVTPRLTPEELDTYNTRVCEGFGADAYYAEGPDYD